MRIYIDFDDVLCETARQLTILARERFDRHVPYEEISVFDLQVAFKLSAVEINTLMEDAHRTTFLEELLPAPGSLAAMKLLEAQGHQLVIVTGRPLASHAGSLAWLCKHGLAHLEMLYFDKYGRSAAEDLTGSKLCVLQRKEFAALHFDVAIEDAPAALDLLVPRQNCTVIIYDRPWNQGYFAAQNMLRGRSWPEIIRLIGDLKQTKAGLS